MTNEEKRKVEWLNRLKDAENEVARRRRQLNAYERITPTYSGMGSGGTNSTSKTEQYTLAKRYMEESERQMEKIRREVLKAINSIQNRTNRDVLMLRYVDHMQWEYIEPIIGFSQRHTKRIHISALQELRLPEEKK